MGLAGALRLKRCSKEGVVQRLVGQQGGDIPGEACLSAVDTRETDGLGELVILLSLEKQFE